MAGRKHCATFLKYIKQDINSIVDTNTLIPEDIRVKCAKKFGDIKDFDIPDICGQMEHTRVYVNHELESHIVTGSIDNDLQKPLVINEVKN